MTWLRRSGAIWGVLLALTACQGEPPPKGVKIGKPYVIDGKTYFPAHDPDYDKTGDGSWYGPGFHGKRTANGEPFNQDDLTAAHPTLPMPSLVRVTNLKNDKSVVVRINDRGPFKKSRIIDLSKGSAERIGLHSTMPVRVQYLRAETEAYLAALEAGEATDMFAYNDSLDRGENTLLAKYKAAVPSTPSAPSMSESEFAQAPTTGDTSVQVVEVASLDAPSARAGSSEIQHVAPLSSVESRDLRGPSAPVPGLMNDAWADDNRTMPTPPKRAEQNADEMIVVEDDSIIDERAAEEAIERKAAQHAQANEKIIMPLPTQHTPKSSKQVPLGSKATASAQQPATPATKPAAKQASATASTVQPLSAKSQAKAAKQPESLAAKAPASGSASGLVLQAGSYSSEANARALAKKLGKASVDKVDVSGKSWWRVHAGPFASQAEADKALAAAKSAGVADARITQKH